MEADRFERIANDLRQLDAILGHVSEQSEAKVENINELIQLVDRVDHAQTGDIVLGEVIFTLGRPDWAPNSDSGDVYQAALHCKRGVGVICWDSESYCAAKDEGKLEYHAMMYFVPFANCSRLLKTLLYPHIDRLLEPLLREVGELKDVLLKSRDKS